MVIALKGLHKIAQGQQQRHPGMGRIPLSLTLKGLNKSWCRYILCNPFRVDILGVLGAWFPRVALSLTLGLFVEPLSGQKIWHVVYGVSNCPNRTIFRHPA
jgi:hypothetical protein